MFELNSQSNYPSLFRAPEASCWSAVIVYVSARATLLTFFNWTLNRQLEDRKEQLAESDETVAYMITIAE